MRKAISLVLGLAMVSGALWLGYQELFVASYLSVRLIWATGFVLLVGGYILWAGVLSSPKKGDGAAGED